MTLRFGYDNGPVWRTPCPPICVSDIVMSGGVAKAIHPLKKLVSPSSALLVFAQHTILDEAITSSTYY